MGDDRATAFSVECIPPSAGNPVPQEFQPSLAHYIRGLPDSRYSDSPTARLPIYKIGKSRFFYAESYGATFTVNHVLSVFRSVGFDNCYYP